MKELKLDLKGFTARQYAALILRDELGYSYERAGNRLGLNRFAFRELYKRAVYKHETKTIYAIGHFTATSLILANYIIKQI